MSNRTGKYMKPGTRASAPGVVFTVAIETVNSAVHATHRTVAKVFARAFLTRSVYRRGSWSPLETSVHGTPESALEWIRERSVKGRCNWIVPQDAQQALTLLRWWERAEALGIRLVDRKGAGSHPAKVSANDTAIHIENLVVRTGTTVLTYYESGVRFRWASYRQFASSVVGEVAAGSAVGADQDDGTGAGITRAVSSAEASARSVSLGFRALCEFWRGHSRAPFGTTVGQLAVGMLRSYIAPKAISTHTDPDAHRLERAASFGGRASVWFVGAIGDWQGPRLSVPDDQDGRTEPHLLSKLHHVDIRSMYPHLLATERYPVRLISVRERVKVKEAIDISREFGTIARVRINTQIPEYPFRTGERVLYPVGTFNTCLTGPELIRASEDSNILSVDELCVYAVGSPFAGAASAMLDLRADADRRGNSSDGTFAKLLANSMAGKLAQRSGGWERWREMDSPGTWGEQHLYDNRTGTRTRVRYIAGLCWKWVEDKTGRGPYTFAFAYLAAYGRLLMRSIRESLPARSVVSQDTDGLWVTDDGIDALAALGHPTHDGPGALRLTRSVYDARFWSPRHYCAGEQWTLAGFSSPIVTDDMSKIKDVFDQNVWTQRVRSAPSVAFTSVRESALSLADVGGTVGPDGWVVPIDVSRSAHAL